MKLPDETGLQVYRSTYNELTDGNNGGRPIRWYHALAENPFLQVPAALAPAAATVLATGGLGLIPVLGGAAAFAVAYPASKFILKHATGQARMERQWLEHFMSMDEDRFKLMANYLTEKNIKGLNTHVVILNALTKAAERRAQQTRNTITPQLNQVDEEIRQLSAINAQSRTPEQNQRLSDLNTRRAELHKELSEANSYPDQIRQGMKAKSAEIRGNYKGWRILNWFAKRNPTTSEYSKPLNDYADGERAADEERALAQALREQGREDEAIAAEARAVQMESHQRDVMTEHSRSRSRVRSASVLNGDEHGTMISVISRQADNTLKHIAMISTAAAGVWRMMRNINQAIEAAERNGQTAIDNAREAKRVSGINNQNVSAHEQQIHDLQSSSGSMTNSEFTQAAGSEIAHTANAKEMEAVHRFGTVSHTNPDYVRMDTQTNSDIDSAWQNLQSMDPSKMGFAQKLRYLAAQKRLTGAAMDQTSQAMNGMSAPMSGVDHTAQTQVMGTGKAGNDIEAKMLETLADIHDKIQRLKPGVRTTPNVSTAIEHAQRDYVGPVAALFAPLIGITKDWKAGREERRARRIARREQRQAGNTEPEVEETEERE